MASKCLNFLVLVICCEVIAGYPQNSSDALINVKDSEDEFIIKKPDSLSDPEYNKFLEELYRQDSGKHQKISKRSSDQEHLPLNPDEFDIPDKPKNEDKNYESFVKELYRQDTLKRNKRMIVFRLFYRI